MASALIITVFGSGRVLPGDAAYEQALCAGRLIAEAGAVVCNGGYRGVMEASARGARDAGGRTIGITTPEFEVPANPWIDEERKAASWQERLFSLIRTGDAYLFFDGAIGTLTELLTVWEMTNKGILRKPAVLLSPYLARVTASIQTNPAVQSPALFSQAENPEEAVKKLTQDCACSP